MWYSVTKGTSVPQPPRLETMKNPKKFGIVGAVLAAGLVLTGCTAHHTDPSMVALRYSGGLTEGGKFVECVDPGVKQVSNDTYYNYPTTQREDVWDSDRYDPDAGANSPADGPDLQVTDNSGNVGFLKLKVVFTLNTECETLREFHEKIGRTRTAWFDENSQYGSGWLWVMHNYISSAVEELSRNAAVNYSVEELWLQPAVRAELAADIQEKIQKAVNDRMEGDKQFFNIGTVSVLAANPTPEFQTLYQDRKNAQVRAETAEANKTAQIAEAQAQTAVALEQAKARAAEIAGWGGADAYLKWLMIESGMNPYQPTYGTAPTPVTPVP